MVVAMVREGNTHVALVITAGVTALDLQIDLLLAGATLRAFNAASTARIAITVGTSINFLATVAT